MHSGGKISASVTISVSLFPISQAPDQPAIAAPSEKIRMAPIKNGSAKATRAVNGMHEEMKTEKIYN